MNHFPLRQAVIIIGSNSTRLLTADLDAALSHPSRERVETRLFLSLSDGNAFAPKAVLRLRQAVTALFEQAQKAGAQRVHLLATSAVRDSRSQEELRQGMLQDTGLRLQVLSGAEEAAYAFLGAACTLPAGERLGVVDIGGGSSEIAAGTLHRLDLTLSLQTGASRLLKIHPINRPEDIAPALIQVGHIAENALGDVGPLPKRWLLVGGTGSALRGLMTGRLPTGMEQDDFPFTRTQAEETLRLLAGLPADARAALPGMTPGREHILPTGLAILISLMKRLALPDMRVTARNNTDGFLYAMSRDIRKGACRDESL